MWTLIPLRWRFICAWHLGGSIIPQLLLSIGEKVCLTSRGLLYNQHRKSQQNQHNTQHTTHNTQHTTHNTQHTTRWAATTLLSSSLLPSISTGTSAMPPALCAMDNYGSVDGAMRWVHSGCSPYPCFGRHYCTHQKIERGTAPWL
jgi:hypothetical protein